MSELPDNIDDLILLANAGDAAAQHELCNRYFFAHGTEKDDEKALYWCRKAAEQQYPDAMYALGCFYELGQIINEDKEEALRLFRKAAERGHEASQYSLGHAYYAGSGVERDAEHGV